MHLGPINARKMFDMLLEIKQEIKELKEAMDPAGTKAKKDTKAKKEKELAAKEFKEK